MLERLGRLCIGLGLLWGLLVVGIRLIAGFDKPAMLAPYVDRLIGSDVRQILYLGLTFAVVPIGMLMVLKDMFGDPEPLWLKLSAPGVSPSSGSRSSSPLIPWSCGFSPGRCSPGTRTTASAGWPASARFWWSSPVCPAQSVSWPGCSPAALGVADTTMIAHVPARTPPPGTPWHSPGHEPQAVCHRPQTVCHPAQAACHRPKAA
jgi:hypothetical protein